MISTLVVLLFAAVIPGRALSFVGQDSAGDLDLPSLDPVCRIYLYNPELKLTGVCSGALTGRREVSTAAHCLSVEEDHPRLRIACGYRASRPQGTGVEITPTGTALRMNEEAFSEHFADYDSIVVDEPGPDHMPIDLARIYLAEESAIAPFRKVEPEMLAAYYERVKLGDCYAAGFGLGPDQRGGGLRAARLSPARRWVRGLGAEVQASEFTTAGALREELAATEKDFSYPRSEFRKSQLLAAAGLIKLALQPGDSGGPLFCPNVAGGPPVLLGVATAGGVGLQLGRAEPLPARQVNVWTLLARDTMRPWPAVRGARRPPAAAASPAGSP